MSKIQNQGLSTPTETPFKTELVAEISNYFTSMTLNMSGANDSDVGMGAQLINSLMPVLTRLLSRQSEESLIQFPVFINSMAGILEERVQAVIDRHKDELPQAEIKEIEIVESE